VSGLHFLIDPVISGDNDDDDDAVIGHTQFVAAPVVKSTMTTHTQTEIVLRGWMNFEEVILLRREDSLNIMAQFLRDLRLICSCRSLLISLSQEEI